MLMSKCFKESNNGCDEQEKCLNCDLMIVMKKRKKGNEKFFHTLEEKINHPNYKNQINHNSVNLI